MGSFANYLEDAALNHIFAVADLPQPSTFLALGLSFDDAAGGTEVTGGSYLRTEITAWEAPASRQTANTGLITFPQASASWGTPDTWAIYDATSGGNRLAWGSITTPKTINTNDIPSFAIGAIDVSLNPSVSDNGWSNSIANAIIGHCFGGSPYVNGNIFIGFGTTPLTDAGTISGEASGGGYARIQHGDGAVTTNWDAASAGVTQNNGVITFTVSGDWTADLDVLFIANTIAGTANTDLLFFGLITAFSATDGDTVEIADAALGLTLT